ncbi:hypothetical protein [Frankia sp. EAN1pec]|uniref:hypothetical protein n=1 Tax=Parafrankia sp. (strain EAN1pec) TaxID=298653 RepID=UPI000054150A
MTIPDIPIDSRDWSGLEPATARALHSAAARLAYDHDTTFDAAEVRDVPAAAADDDDVITMGCGDR